MVSPERLASYKALSGWPFNQTATIAAEQIKLRQGIVKFKRLPISWNTIKMCGLGWQRRKILSNTPWYTKLHINC